MHIQTTVLSKWLGTLITWKKLLSMWSIMHLQTTISWKLFETLITMKKFLTSMCSFVQLPFHTSRWKQFGTMITGKMVFNSMCSFLQLQFNTSWKWFGTVITRKNTQLLVNNDSYGLTHVYCILYAYTALFVQQYK